MSLYKNNIKSETEINSKIKPKENILECNLVMTYLNEIFKI